jgi:GT2 family glycosyltransferase
VALPAATPLLTIAICTRNRETLLRECAENVIHQIEDDTRVLIVENACTDHTLQVSQALAAAHPCVRVVREPRVGLSHGRNTALATTESRYVLFLDDDALAEPGWLAGYRRFLEAPPAGDLAAVGGAVIPWYDAPPPRWLAESENRLNFAEVACRMTGRSLPWGCNFACDRVRTLDVGGFGTQLGRRGGGMGAHEETDLFHRLRSAGYSIWWLPGAAIRHRIGSDRLRVGFHWYAKFASGRSTAALRLRERPGRWRQRGWLAGRLLTMPILSLWYLVRAVLTVPIRGGQIAVKATASAARALGMLWQLLLDTPRILRGEL